MSERMQRLAQFCVETRFEDLPPALVAQAKRHLLDTFGAALAGAGSEVAKQARQVFVHCRLEAYDDDQRDDPRIAHWMSRIRLEVDRQLSEDGEPVISVRTVDGRQASLCVDVPLGAPGNPLSDAALEEKFFSLAVRAMSRRQAQALFELLWRLEELESVDALIVPTRSKGMQPGTLRVPAEADAERPLRHSHADGSTPRRGNDQSQTPK